MHQLNSNGAAGLRLKLPPLTRFQPCFLIRLTHLVTDLIDKMDQAGIQYLLAGGQQGPIQKSPTSSHKILQDFISTQFLHLRMHEEVIAIMNQRQQADTRRLCSITFSDLWHSPKPEPIQVGILWYPQVSGNVWNIFWLPTKLYLDAA